MLIKRGAEAEIHLIEWYGRKAVSKIRIPKGYRNAILDEEIRRRRTMHETRMLSDAKRAGVPTPLLYAVNPKNAEIIMQYIDGVIIRDILVSDLELCKEMGILTAKLHTNNIIHGDLTTSNFLLYKDRVVLIDFGLSFHSTRIEDKAVDIRLIKEVLSSAHADLFNDSFKLFIDGYRSVADRVSDTKLILKKVTEIEHRGRYARVV